MLALALVLAVAAAEPQPPPRRPPAAEPAESEVRAARAAALARAGEPSVEAVQRAAAAQLDAEAEQLASLRRRARRAAWLPRLSAELEHDDRSTRVVGFTGSSESDYLRLSPGTRAGVRATWDLDRLAFTRDELAIAEAQAHAARQRRERVEQATRLFFLRLRLKVELALAPPDSALERVRSELELGRVTAELDALTGGLLGRRAAPAAAGGEG
jgi:hypothetical protein